MDCAHPIVSQFFEYFGVSCCCEDVETPGLKLSGGSETDTAWSAAVPVSQSGKV